MPRATPTSRAICWTISRASRHGSPRRRIDCAYRRTCYDDSGVTPHLSDDALVIRGRRVVTPTGVRPASVHVEHGRITRVGEWNDASPAPVLDAGDAIVMPGVVDTHVHVNEPGRSEWEGFETATAAAPRAV